MFDEMQHIKNEKVYWMERLTRTTKEIKHKKRKKKKRVNPLKTQTFSRKNKDFMANGSLLLEGGLLTLNNNSMEHTNKYKRARSMRDAKDLWDKPDDPHPSFQRREARSRVKTIYGSEGYELNLANTIGTLSLSKPKATRSRSPTAGGTWPTTHSDLPWSTRPARAPKPGRPSPGRSGTRCPSSK